MHLKPQLRLILRNSARRPHDEMLKFELSDKDIDTIVACINSQSP
jgi:hypothetical protein